MPEPLNITHLGVGLTPDVGADDSLVAVRIIPSCRVGNKIFGRTLLPGETDPGTSIVIDPSKGEELHYPAGSIHISILDIDKSSPPCADGYAPISNTVWTWLTIATPPDPALFRYLFAVSRRLDTAHCLHTEVISSFADITGPFIQQRKAAFTALGVAEMLCITLSRAVDMLVQVPDRFSIRAGLPTEITAHAEALREIRNAFEHIEDRAFGTVHRRAHQDALSIFDQPDFLEKGILSYAHHSIDIGSAVPSLLVAARRYIFDVATATAGPSKVLNQPIAYFATTTQQSDMPPRREVLIAVGSQYGRRSTVWKFAVHENEVQISSGMFGSDSKVSLRSAGDGQWTDARGNKSSGLKNEKRHIVKWSIPCPNGATASHVFQIRIPETELRIVEATENLSAVEWLPVPRKGHTVSLECYITPVSGDHPALSGDLPCQHLFSLPFADGRWFTVLCQVPPLDGKDLEPLRDEMNAQARAFGIHPKPEHRGIAFTGSDNKARGFIELCTCELPPKFRLPRVT